MDDSMFNGLPPFGCDEIVWDEDALADYVESQSTLDVDCYEETVYYFLNQKLYGWKTWLELGLKNGTLTETQSIVWIGPGHPVKDFIQLYLE